MVISLEGKRILYFAPKFFGYELEIAGELSNRGAELDILPDRIFDSPFMTAVTKLRRDWVIPAANRIYREKINAFARTKYDMVFVVNGQTLSKELLHELRLQYPTAQFILYMWDAIKNRRSAIDNLEFFDACFTFDREDASKFSMQFRPLFFSKGFERNALDTEEYDVSFVGTAHTDRYAVVRAVSEQLPVTLKSYWYLFLQAPWVYYYYRLTNPAYKGAIKSDFQFQPVAKAELQKVFFSSRTILDIEHPNQTGLTMRTFETLGSAKKLITTNVKINEYDFFSSENICVIDRQRPTIPASFFTSAYAPLSTDLYRKYSLKGWLDEILSHCLQ